MVSGIDRGRSGVTSIYLARHGETELNAAGALRGHLDPPLDKIGRAQARALAASLELFQPSLIISSPLRRALETAWCIAHECGIGVEIDPRMIDRDYGEWAGQDAGEVRARFGRLDAAPGIESAACVVDRAAAALEAIADRAADGAVVVAHDAVNRLLIASLASRSYPDADAIPQRTGCFNLLLRSNGGWRVTRVDVAPVVDSDSVAKR